MKVIIANKNTKPTDIKYNVPTWFSKALPIWSEINRSINGTGMMKFLANVLEASISLKTNANPADMMKLKINMMTV